MGRVATEVWGDSMKTVRLSTPVQMLFALLRASLHEQKVETQLFELATDEEWAACYHLAASQGVMALAWDGVMTLPAELMPSRKLKLTWASGVVAYEEVYKRYCHTAVELSGYYAEHGVQMMQLKGVGFSTLYPNPMHREGGDIDIYTYAANPSAMSDKEANTLADELMRGQGIEVNTTNPKHSEFYYKGIPIENHKTFLNVETYEAAVQVEQALRDNMQPMSTMLGSGKVLTPSPVFNMLFIAFHACQHYGSGLALHHLCDWVMILKRYGLHMPESVTDKGFLDGVAALTMLCNEYLGTRVEVAADESLAANMLGEILHQRFEAEVPTKNKVGIIVYKTRRLLYTHRLKNRVIYSPLWKRVWTSFIAHLREPKTIFSR